MVLLDNDLITLFEKDKKLPRFYQDKSSLTRGIINFIYDCLQLYTEEEMIDWFKFNDLEDIFTHNYYIIDKNKLFFIYPEQLYDALDIKMMDEPETRLYYE